MIAQFPAIVFDQSGQLVPTNFIVTGTLSAGTNVTPPVVMPFPARLIKAMAHVGTAPVGDNLILDVNKNNSTIWSTQANRLTVDDGETDETTTTFNTIDFVAGDILTLDVDGVGSGTAGADLVVVLLFRVTGQP